MIEPLPKERSIWPSAASRALCLSVISFSTRRNADCSMGLVSLVIPQPLGRCNESKRTSFVPERKFFFCSEEAGVPALPRPILFQQFLNLSGELFEAEGLGEEMEVGDRLDFLGDRLLRIAGDAYHGEIGAARPRRVDHRGAVDRGHHHVGDQEVEGGTLQQLQRRLAGARLDDAVALAAPGARRSDEHTSELPSLMRTSSAVF